MSEYIGGKLRLENNQALQARNAGATAWVDLIKLDASDIPVVAGLAQGSNSDPASMTPVPTGAAGAITTQTSTGRWCRVGPLVFVVCKIVITDVGTATGDLTITLPSALPAAANVTLDQPLALHTESITEASVQLSAKILSNTKTIKLYDVKTNAAADILDVENGTIEVAGCYLAA